MAAFVEHAHQQEQGAGAEAVVDHLQDAARYPLGVQGEDAQHHEAQVADAGVGHQALDVSLAQGHQRAVDDADDGQDGHQGHEGQRGVGKERQAEAGEAVGPHLQQDAGQDHAAGGGCFHVGVGQPGVEGEQRHLDGKAQGEGQE